MTKRVAEKAVAVIGPHEFHPCGRSVMVAGQVKGRGKVSHRPADPDKAALKRRLFDAIDVMRRLAAEKASGADMQAALSRLQAKTFAGHLAMLSGMASGPSRTVTEADLDRLEQTLGWVERHVETVEARRLLLDWARGTAWSDLVAAHGSSQPTLWRRINRALGDILLGLRVENFRGLNK